MKTTRPLALRLALRSTALVAVLVAAFIMANRVGLEWWFVSRSQAAMAAIETRLLRADRPADQWDRDSLRLLGSGAALKITIVDRDGVQTASSVPEFNPSSHLPLPKDQLEWFLANRGRLAVAGPMASVIDKGDRGQSLIQYASAIDSGRFLVISQDLRPLRESAATAEGFFIAIGLVMLAAGAAAAAIGARRLTRPLAELTALAESMADLDFHKRWAGPMGDEIARLGTVMNDLTDRLTATLAELRDSNARLGQTVVRQKRFLAAVSHDFKTPLGIIRGHAELLEDQPGAENHAAIIIEESDRLSRLVDDLLTLARLDSGSLELRRAPLDMGAFAARQAERHRELAAVRGLAYRLQPPPEGLSVSADSQRLAMALDNLVTNAIRHARTGSTIEVSWGVDGSGLYCAVENEGDTIPAEVLGKLFTPFYRADTDRNRSSGGAGLGLSIAREIARLHGGDCSIANTPLGVRAELTLSRDPEDSPA